MIDSVTRLQQIIEKLNASSIPDAAVKKKKIEVVLKNNPSLEALTGVSNFDTTTMEKAEQFQDTSPAELSCFRLA